MKRGLVAFETKTAAAAVPKPLFIQNQADFKESQIGEGAEQLISIGVVLNVK